MRSHFRPRRPGQSRALTIHQFARRAAATAAARQTTVLDVAPVSGCHRRLFDPKRYDSVALRPSRPADYFSDRRRTQPFGPLPVKAERFGVVLCTEVIEQATEPQAVLTELNRALEPHGLLFLSTPLVIEPPVITPGGRPAKVGLNYLLEASGFTIEDLEMIGQTDAYAVVAAKARQPGRRIHTTH